jgi:hypothetical protein
VGVATIIASSGGKQAILNLTVAAPTPVSFNVQSALPSGLLQLSSFTIKARQDDDSVTATFPVGGSVALSGSMVLSDVLQFVASGNGALTSRGVAPSSQAPSSIPIVFIPQSITLGSGGYAGTKIDVNMTLATTPCSVTGNQCQNGFYGVAFSNGVKRWPSFPIPVKIDAALDTARIWDALRALEASAGQKMFELDETGHINRIDVKAGLPPGVSGFSGYTTWNWDGQDRMTFATVWLTTSSSRSLTQHEFLHALGFWHTCAWTSVMGGYGCAQAPEVSASDIAYLLLASAVYDAENKFRTDGQLPCATMSLFATIPNQTRSLKCIGDDLMMPSSVVRQESAP